MANPLSTSSLAVVHPARITPRVDVVVVTGGPCGGKSSLMPRAKQWLEDRGCLVAVLPECATELITAGLPPVDGWRNPLTFQAHLMEYQMEREDRYIRMLQDRLPESDRPRVLLCDRGVFDSLAYIGRPGFLNVVNEVGGSLERLRNRYTSVIHMVTAARGAEQFYTLANNAARRETPEEAAAVDMLTQQAWLGHPHFTVVDNQTAFDEKVRRALTAMARVLHIPEPLEIERKFFVSEYTLPQPVVAVEIEQTYLTAQPGEERRVRKRSLDGVASYFYTTKQYTATPGVRVEKEREIDLGEYEQLLTEKDPTTRVIRKTRYCFLYNERHFEFDVYQGGLSGLKILEVEVSDLNDAITLPPEWKVQEVTGDSTYSNRKLASL